MQIYAVAQLKNTRRLHLTMNKSNFFQLWIQRASESFARFDDSNILLAFSTV